MNDIGLTGNTIAAITILYSIACGFCGAAIAFGMIERRNRKARQTKHKPTNIIA
jgi:hypothetical protein